MCDNGRGLRTDIQQQSGPVLVFLKRECQILGWCSGRERLGPKCPGSVCACGSRKIEVRRVVCAASCEGRHSSRSRSGVSCRDAAARRERTFLESNGRQVRPTWRRARKSVRQAPWASLLWGFCAEVKRMGVARAERQDRLWKQRLTLTNHSRKRHAGLPKNRRGRGDRAGSVRPGNLPLHAHYAVPALFKLHFESRLRTTVRCCSRCFSKLPMCPFRDACNRTLCSRPPTLSNNRTRMSLSCGNTTRGASIPSAALEPSLHLNVHSLHHT